MHNNSMLRRWFGTEREKVIVVVRKGITRWWFAILKKKKSIKIFKQRTVQSQATIVCNSHSYSSSEASMLTSLLVTGDGLVKHIWLHQTSANAGRLGRSQQQQWHATHMPVWSPRFMDLTFQHIVFLILVIRNATGNY